MKAAIFITALFGAAIAAPAPNAVPQDLDTRASCPGGQSCVGGYCTVYTCVPAGTSTQCFTYNLYFTTGLEWVAIS
ncbi:unnamed protein product [Fusarium venenatum]|uniref:CBM1 domain-containing protein n=1 Tax=Fusarium venenatum TaxID=56646 RepID=A0A2L2SRS9_9HYPO|nr:uncharacterized protein FVRRES_13717 [Fusarium venenatum]CEI41736.1 unnamed protein product [Fusarium venenatum]